ncbi:Ubiquitin carboxyl-terminal hydrolase MINDY-1 [Geranomyces variabilis]|uniref:Ubiquitin carboxyl-terminal hydrolase MINDY-1 n=1 Tax=Geranomyces variabilis TaxID=109894 RepID=A0AAD5TUX6_9FUNG|nr:Ubiquitin carboxyl-terminal hydrolase MINDY-1 [Geranomyces variabilis]
MAAPPPPPAETAEQQPTSNPPPPKQQAPPQPQQPPQADKLYRLKRIIYIDARTQTPQRLSIITQNRNGPCPLLALTNVLILRGDITIPHVQRERGEIAYEQIVEIVGDWLTTRRLGSSSSPTTTNGNAPPTDGDALQNLTDVFEIIPTLQTGLDVNVRFSSPTSFELTPALLVFDAFNIHLCHGWTVDPQDTETYSIVVNTCGSYNAVVEKIIQGDDAATALRTDKGKKPRATTDDDDAAESTLLYEKKEAAREQHIHDGLVCAQFLASTSSQLTYHGLQWLCDDVAMLPAGEPAVLFRNNHFHTVLKRLDEDGDGGGAGAGAGGAAGVRLYTLVTDQGFLHAEGAVWETMSGVDGDSSFVDGYFVPFAPDARARGGGGGGGGGNGNGNGGSTTGGVIGPGDYADAPSPTLESHRRFADSVGGGGGDDAEGADLALALALQQEEEEQFAARDHDNNHRPAAAGRNNNDNTASPKSPKSPKGKKEKCTVM